MIKKIFRNPASDILFVIGLAIACVILLNIADLVSRIKAEEDSQYAYKYSIKMLLTYSTYNIDEKTLIQGVIEEFDKLNEGNVYINTSKKIDNKIKGNFIYILMESNEKLAFDYIEGGYDEEKIYENALIIGESLKSYIKEENGYRYIEIGGIKFNVIGVIENNMSGGVDTSLYIIWDTLSNSAKESLLLHKDSLGEIYYESNVGDGIFRETVQKIKDTYGAETHEFKTRNVVDDENVVYMESNKMLLTIAMFFSIITCFSVSYIWLLNRKNELAVRMAYGYSVKNMFILLFMDIIKLMLPSFSLSVIVQIIYSFIIDRNVLLGDMVLIYIGIIFAGMLMITILNTLYMIRKLKGFKAVMVNKEA